MDDSAVKWLLQIAVEMEVSGHGQQQVFAVLAKKYGAFVMQLFADAGIKGVDLWDAFKPTYDVDQAYNILMDKLLAAYM